MKMILRKTKPIIFNNNDFQTIQIKVYFPFKRDEKYIAYMNLLPELLHHVCSKYPTERDYSLQMQKLFILSCFCFASSIIQDSYFCFHITIPDVHSLKQDLLEEQFQFFSEMIYHPKLDGEKFCIEEFQREVENLKVDIEKAFKDNGSYAFIKVREIIDPDGEYSKTIYNHQEQIDLVTPENLYQFYLDTIYNNQPLVYVFGNVDTKRIETLCNQYIYRVPISEKKFMIETKHYLPVLLKEKNVVEKSDFKNSVYITCYKVKDMCEEDEVLLSIVKSLLSSQSSRLLMQALRDENDLVYQASVMSSNSYGLLGIVAFIHKDNLEEVKQRIKDVLFSLKDTKIVDSCLKNIQERSRISLIRQLDDKTMLFTDAIIENLGIDLTNQEFHEKLMKVSSQDVSCFIDRLVLDTSYFLEEGDHA